MQVTRVGIPIHKNYTPVVQETPREYHAQISQDTFVKRSMHPTFEGYITSTWKFKQLTREHFIHCPYCRRYMFYGGTLEEMLRTGIFSGSVKDFVTAVNPYKKVLKKGHKEVFSVITKYAQKNPNATLSEVMNSMYSTSIRHLRKRQGTIFKELYEAAKELPEDLNAKFRGFMKIQHKRLYGIPHIEKFNSKVFSYKLSKMLQTLNIELLQQRLSEMVSPLMEPVFKDMSATVPEEILTKITKGVTIPNNSAEDVVRYVIDLVKTVGKQLDRKDIVDLCQTSTKMLNGKPVIVPFSNKEFMHDMMKYHLAPIKGSHLYHKMSGIAKKLPTSDSNMNSFVVKNHNSGSDMIGYKLLEPSVTTIEHINPSSEGGADTLENMALSCKADNNERQSMLQYVYLRKWPRNNPQIYFDDIIFLTNKERIFPPHTVEGMADSFWQQGRVKINLSKLRGRSGKQ